MTACYRCASIILYLHLAASLSFCDESKLISELRKLPGVHSVTSTPVKTKPKQIIIHLLNWHYISKEDFATDLSDSSDGELSEAEIEKRYRQFLDDVEAIQNEQEQILKYLIEKHKVRSVFLEGLSKKNLSAFNSFIKTLREFEMPEGDGALDLFFKEQYRRDCLQMGAAAQLKISGMLESVLPLENAEAFEAANPVGKDGKVRIDKNAEEKREDEMVKLLMKGEGISVILLGGGHDLTDNLKRMKVDSVLYFRVSGKQYERVVNNQD
ncbi:MAG: hypothetical protein CME33_19625 [Gimesia sp.]|uniref:hypothetical protein n=1 Tax=Gimesia sp. TaxID=2024833 RepID=UPI000C3665E0|nr:hypothetical protein [Gimesia sp.]MAX38773.1 hypothetical protein [Gimesia sp.]|tara:strand:+ start:40 stop:843 length:804 start_codon:yes stop_codon:yes gene_type:complete